jgi:hypothetical protein
LALSQECQTITTRDGGLEKIEVPAPLRNPQPLAKSLTVLNARLPAAPFMP